MGRAKIAMEFITKEKARNVTYAKRKKGLLKKAHEFAILCNVPVCVIIYPFNEGKLPSEPEVYTFKGNEGLKESTSMNLSKAKDPEAARKIIERYLGVPVEERTKRALNLCDMFDEWKRKADQELSKLRHKNAMAKYPYLCSMIDDFTPDKLMELLVHLDGKLRSVNQRIAKVKGYNNNSGMEQVIDPATPVSSFVIPSNNNANHFDYHIPMAGIDNVELLNQFPIYGYPMISTISSNMQDSPPMRQFNPGFCQDQKGLMGFEYGGNNCNPVFHKYNMNMVYYGQGPGFECAGETSAYGTGMPMSMPLQLPMLPSCPQPGQFQLFYE